MKPFNFVNAESVAHACSLLGTDSSGAVMIAGGTDLMGEIKEGIVTPETVVNLPDGLGLVGIEATSDGMTIGAMTTVADIAAHQIINADFPALAQAASSVATPQIRNVGTLGGNLCQRPRCWYYRSPMFDCRKKGGAICFAENGSNKYHAILGATDCYIVHPSDLAVALMSLQAEVTITGGDASRTIPLDDLFVGPEVNILAETCLAQGEIVTEVFVPAATEGRRSVYLKARERQAQDFALVSVASCLRITDGVIQEARIVLGGVAPVPYRLFACEESLIGARVEQLDTKAIGQLAVRDAQPLRDNHYKVRLASSLVSRAVETLIALDPQ